MFNNQYYYEMVRHVIDNIPGHWVGRIKQLPAGNGTHNFTLQFPPGDERQGLQIIYRTRDLYILGYITPNGTSYATFDQTENVAGATNLGFRGDYSSLGWDRSSTLTVNHGGPMVNVAEVDTALYTVANGKASKSDMCVLAIALAEAVRFKDVEKAVREGSRITTDMVDWNQQLANGNNANLRPG